MWCKIGDQRVWYQAHGKGVPIIFLHGWSMDHRDETQVYEPIFAKRPGYRRLYPNLPGMGKSPAGGRIKNQDDYLDIVRHWLRHFGVSAAKIAACERDALNWALGRGSRSGRVAWQFARDLAGHEQSARKRVK